MAGSVSRQEAVRRLKESVSGHRTGLPKKLLDLFAPRDLLKSAPPPQKKKPALPYNGLAQYVEAFAEPGDPEYEPPPPEDRPPSPRLYRNLEFDSQARIDTESKLEKKIRLTKWKTEQAAKTLEDAIKTYDPNNDRSVKGDPFKTLFVARLSYDVTEKKLRREFEEYGPIKHIRMVENKKTSKPRGYAFIEFEHKNDFKTAYKMADGKKLEGRRILVDCERGRTVDNWRPRRLGGGLGGESRLPKEPKKLAGTALAAPLVAAAEPPRSAYPERRDMRGDRGDRRDDRERMRGRDDRERDRDRKRERSPDRGHGRDEKRRHFEDGEVRDIRRDRRRERDVL